MAAPGKVCVHCALSSIMLLFLGGITLCLFLCVMYLMTQCTFFPFESLPTSKSTKESPKVTPPWQHVQHPQPEVSMLWGKTVNDMLLVTLIISFIFNCPMSFNAVLVTLWCVIAYKYGNILWDGKKKKTDQMSNAVPSIGACSDIVLLSFYCPVFSLFIYISINLFLSLLWTFWKSGSLSKMEDLEAQNFISMTIT